MGGLLLRDFMILGKTYRNFLVTILIFAAVAVLTDNILFMLYPVVIAGLIPTSLISVDEKEGWDAYSLTLPLSKKQIVSAKYLLGSICTLGTALAMAFLWGIFLLVRRQGAFLLPSDGGEGALPAGELLLVIIAAVSIGFFGLAISLPPVFKMGMAKGSLFYRIMIGVVMALAFAFVSAKDTIPALPISEEALAAGILAAAAVIYMISWQLSIWFYQKREL